MFFDLLPSASQVQIYIDIFFLRKERDEEINIKIIVFTIYLMSYNVFLFFLLHSFISLLPELYFVQSLWRGVNHFFFLNFYFFDISKDSYEYFLRTYRKVVNC